MSASFGLSQLSFRIPILSDIYDFLKNLPNIIMSALNYILSSLLYGIQMGFFFLIDMIQAVFRKIAGLDVYWYRESSNTYTNVEGDIVETFIKSDTVWNIFIAVCVAAIILLFVTTIIAILKTELNEKDNSKTPVIKNALKAVAYFVMVPVVCVFGIALANIFLRSFDSATAYKGATSISGQVFASASFNANRVRSEHLAGDSDLSDIKERLKPLNTDPKIRDSSSRAEIADALDYAFVHDLSCKDVEYYFGDMDDYMAGYAYILGGKKHYHKTSFDKYTMELVYYYYDMMNYNYLIGYFASYTIIMLLLNLMIGVIQRIFDLTILFIVSPAFIATMPLDEGQRFKKWKDTFISKTLGLYGPIIGINLAFTILTLVQRIYIFDPSGGGLNGLFNSLMQCIFVIVAILCVKDFGKLLNTIIGGDDITNNKAADVSKIAQKAAAVGTRAAALGAKGVTAAGLQVGSGLRQRSARKKVEEAEAEEDAARIEREQIEGAEEALNQQVQDRKLGYTAAERIDMQNAFQSSLSAEQQDYYRKPENREEWNKAVDEYITNQAKQDIGYDAQKSDIDAMSDANHRRRAEAAANVSAATANYNSVRSDEEAIRQKIRNDYAKTVGQDVYGMSNAAFKGSSLDKATEEFRKAGGVKAAEEIGTNIVGQVYGGLNALSNGVPRSGGEVVRNIDGSVKEVKLADSSVDTFENGLKNLRINLKTEGEGKKAKEERDKAKDNADLAKAIANALAGILSGGSGGSSSGGTP